MADLRANSRMGGFRPWTTGNFDPKKKADLAEVYTQSQLQTNGQATVHWGNLTGVPSYSPSGHNHDDRYYTETEVNNLLSGKANSSHSHTFASLTSKPTTLAGYGITDGITKSELQTELNSLVNSAPGVLDTLGEIAKALGDDPNFATTMTTELSKKADASTLSNHTGNSSIHITAAERSTWNSKANGSHTHAISDVTNLQTELNKKFNSAGGTISGNATITGSLTVGSGTATTLTSLSTGEIQIGNTNGYIQVGPKNGSYAHIYTDRPYFYFNKDLMVNAKRVYHTGNLNPAEVVSSTTQPTSGLADGLMWYNPTEDETKVYFNGAFRDIGSGGAVYTPYRNTFVSTLNTANINIGIPSFAKGVDALFVYVNSTFVQEGVDYEISVDGTQIVKKSGLWNAGTTFDFMTLSIESAKVKPDTLNTVMLDGFHRVTTVRSTIPHGIAEYNKATDSLLAFHNGTALAEGEHYNVGADSASITLTAGYLPEVGDEFFFVVIKKIRVGYSEKQVDGAMIIPASIPKEALNFSVPALYKGSAPPTNPDQGQEWFDTNVNRKKYWTGTTWITM